MTIKVTDLPVLSGVRFKSSDCVRLKPGNRILYCGDIQNIDNPIEIFDNKVHEILGYTKNAPFKGSTKTNIALMFIEEEGDEPRWVHLKNWEETEESDIDKLVKEINSTEYADYPKVFVKWRRLLFNPETPNEVLDAVFLKLRSFLHEENGRGQYMISIESVINEAYKRWHMMIEYGMAEVDHDDANCIFKIYLNIYA